MAFRMIEQSFWTDPKVDDEFTPEDKYFYMYLLTNPHTNMLGCYEISMKQMERETGYNEDTVKRLIERMQNYHEVIQYDSHTKEVLITNWYKYNWTNSKKVLCCLEQDFNNSKSEELKSIVADILAEKYGIDTLSIPYPYPMDITNNNNNNNNNNDISSELIESPTEPTVISIPLNSGFRDIVQSEIDKWSNLYPNVDVMQQLRNMVGWCDSNPTKRKTKAGVNRFINAWLSREQDKGGYRVRENGVKVPIPRYMEEQKNGTLKTNPVSAETLARAKELQRKLGRTE